MGSNPSKSSLISDPAVDPLPYLTADLPRHIVETKLPPGSGRLFRSFRIRSRCGATLVCKAAVVKFAPVTLKRSKSKTNLGLAGANDSVVSNSTADISNIHDGSISTASRGAHDNHPEITKFEIELNRIWSAVGDPTTHPNVMPYQSFFVGPNPTVKDRSGLQSQPVYLLRQHCFMTLADRLATRPFLTVTEKTWIAYQILKALESIHESGVCHGYVSTDNILVTSWGWVILSDFACYKPTCVPDNDPSDFIFYFQRKTDSENHREKRCYLAPERLYTKKDRQKDVANSSDDNGSIRLTPEMDIFAAGCVFVELFLNGEGAFDLGDLLEYRKKGSVESLSRKLNKIESLPVRDACCQMLSLDPKLRLSAHSYLMRLSAPTLFSDGRTAGKVRNMAPFPQSFGDFLWPLMKRLRYDTSSADGRIALVARSYGKAVGALCGSTDANGDKRFRDICGPNIFEEPPLSHGDEGSTAVVEESRRDEPSLVDSWEMLIANTESLLQKLEACSQDEFSFNDILPVASNLATTATEEERPTATTTNAAPRSSPTLVILLQLVLSAIRHVQRPSSKLVALQLLDNFGKYVDDEARLQRIVPTVVSLIEDTDTLVRAMAIKVLASVVSIIRTFPPSDALLFPQYIFPRVDALVNDPDVLVRVAFAGSIGKLAQSARWFLDVNEGMKLHETIKGGGSKRKEDGLPSSKQENTNDVVPEFPEHVSKLLDDDPGSAKENSSQEDNSVSNSVQSGDVAVNVLIPNDYDKNLSLLHDAISRWVVQVTTNSKKYSSLPKLALLNDLSRLCSFFGKEGTTGIILPQILAFLNDRRDWELRAALCIQLPTVCAIVGRIATEQFVVPCVEIALIDGEERVVSQAVLCLNNLVKMSLLTRSLLLGEASNALSAVRPKEQNRTVSPAESGVEITGIISKCAPLLIHPSASVRQSMVKLISTVCSTLEFPDDIVLVLPMLKPFLRYILSSQQLRVPAEINACLLSPVPMTRFDGELQRLHGIKDANKRLQGKQKVTLHEKNQQREKKYMPPKQMDGDDQVFDDILSVIGGGSSYVSQVSQRSSDNGPVHQNEDLCSFESIRSHPTDSQECLPPTIPPFHENLQPLNPGMGKFLEFASNYRQSYFRRSKRILSLRRKHLHVEADAASTSRAFSFIVPSQKYVEMLANPLPTWFDDLRDAASVESQLCSPLSAFRSLATVADVYSLSLTQPTSPLQSLRKWKGENTYSSFDFSNDGIHPGLENFSPSHASRLLSSRESQMLEAAKNGEWGSIACLDPTLLETALLVAKVDSLMIPPLPPRLGLLRETDGRAYSWHSPNNVVPNGEAPTVEVNRRSGWTPHVDTLTASSPPSGEHNAAVTRLAISQDQSFFVSGSHDGTCRVWEMRRIENVVGLQSSLVYKGHNSNGVGRVNDVCIVENSHSLVSGSSDGSVHVWRVDSVQPSKTKISDRNESNAAQKYYDTARVCGSSVVRNIDPEEGEILAVGHFNSNTASLVTFASQKGHIHSWDLRSAKEPFKLKLRPELGYLTSMATGTDRNWLIAGTNRGYIALWDIRFQMMVKLWQHSSGAPVSRLATCYTTLPQDKTGDNVHAGDERKPFMFVGCGKNEASVFDVTNGACRQCFRVLDPMLACIDQALLPESCVTMPTLKYIAVPSNQSKPIISAVGNTLNMNRISSSEPSILSLMGRIGATGRSYLITGGSDRCLRYWDFNLPSRCYTISGFVHAQPVPTYESVSLFNTNETSVNQNLFLCRSRDAAPNSDVPSSDLPHHLQQGLVKPENAHRDAILDIKSVDYPRKSLLSCSRDGVIKLWQ